LVYRVPTEGGKKSDRTYMLVVNAGNIKKDWDWVNKQNKFDKDSQWFSTPYEYYNTFLTGFSHVNLSGVGCPDLGVLLLMPTTGKVETDHLKYGSTYSNEIAKTAYYSNVLDKYKVKVELTASKRVGVSRYSFPKGKSNILLNLGLGLTNEQGAMVIGLVNPVALALLEAPGNWGKQGVDIAVGEAQPLGIPLSSGGPYIGFMACKQKLVRQLPGRIVGRTVDLDGNPGFTLTLQAREQHIRRSKATSNICTNQGLMATATTLYLAFMGRDGLQKVAAACVQNTQTLIKLLTQNHRLNN